MVRPNHSNLRVERKPDGGAAWPFVAVGSLCSEGHRTDNFLINRYPRPVHASGGISRGLCTSQ